MPNLRSTSRPRGLRWRVFSLVPVLAACSVVRWTNVAPTFTDSYPTYSSWAGETTPLAYRCMWTNELR